MAMFVPKDRKSLFRQFLAGMYDAVVITDPNGHILEINRRAEEHFGWTQDEVLDRPVGTLIPGLSPDIIQRIRTGLEEDNRMMIDGSAVNKQNERFACEVTVSVIDLMDPNDLVFTVRNIERRRKLRDRLRAKEGAFELSPSALFACDPSGHFTEVNAAFLEMFELESEEAARRHVFTDLINDDPLPANFARALAGERTTVDIVAESDEADVRTEIEVKLAPLKAGARVTGVVGSLSQV